MLSPEFFQRPPLAVASALLGKVLRRKYRGHWLSARIIETEAYYTREKGSHSSLGKSPSRMAMFAPPGTIYMYYARGAASLNVSCKGAGNACLIKAAVPYFDKMSPEKTTLARMQALNPPKSGQGKRAKERLLAGQTLLCRSLGLDVPDWNGKQFDPEEFFLEDVGYEPSRKIQARRIGIPLGRDEHLLYRFVDYGDAEYCTRNPLKGGGDFRILVPKGPVVRTSHDFAKLDERAKP